MELNLNCLRCKGKMEEGFIVDHTGRYNEGTVSEWAAGPPQSGFWTGLKVNEPRQVSTFRCTGCGYLESYAK